MQRAQVVGCAASLGHACVPHAPQPRDVCHMCRSHMLCALVGCCMNCGARYLTGNGSSVVLLATFVYHMHHSHAPCAVVGARCSHGWQRHKCFATCYVDMTHCCAIAVVG
jgi:hypothetical protein